MDDKKGNKEIGVFRVIEMPPETSVCEWEVFYRWFDKDTKRHYNVLFDDDGDMVGGYSFGEDEDDSGEIISCQKKVVIPGGGPVYFKYLREDEEITQSQNKK